MNPEEPTECALSLSMQPPPSSKDDEFPDTEDPKPKATQAGQGLAGYV